MNFTPPEIDEYCELVSSLPSPECTAIEKHTKAHVEFPQMLTGPLVGSFLQFLIRSIKAKTVLEFGTYTGYSALCMAEALPADGKVITLDINEATTKLAKSFWEKSAHGRKIQSMLGPARLSVDSIQSTVDFVFIDANKPGYIEYCEKALEKLSAGGLIVADNCLWSGRVLDQKNADEDTRALQAFNLFIHNHPALCSVLLPVRDGLHLIRRR